MKRIPTFVEFVVSTIMTILGIYMLIDGSANNAASSNGPVLIGGAVCFILGVMILVSAIRFLLWHRRMLRESRSRLISGEDPFA